MADVARIQGFGGFRTRPPESPHCGVVEKAGMRPLRRSLFTNENIKSTPPLRGSRRSRAVCAKADAVGGGLLCGMSPHRFGFGFTPSPHRLPLKGGVYLAFSSVALNPRLSDFFNSPITRRPALLILSRRECAVSKDPLLVLHDMRPSIRGFAATQGEGWGGLRGEEETPG